MVVAESVHQDSVGRQKLLLRATIQATNALQDSVARIHHRVIRHLNLITLKIYILCLIHLKWIMTQKTTRSMIKQLVILLALTAGMGIVGHLVSVPNLHLLMIHLTPIHLTHILE